MLLALALLLAAPLAGCLGDGSDAEDDAPAFRVFLAATGASDASANVSSIGVKRGDAGPTQFLPVKTSEFDLGQLSDSGQAMLAASSTDLQDNVTRTVVVFNELTVGQVTLEDVRLEIPLSYPAGPGLEATVTLNLTQTEAEEEPKLAHLVVEQDGTQIASITGAQLAAGIREKVVPLPEPRIVATSETNDTAPSFLINTPITFTVRINETPDAKVREVFWSFSDGSTTSGRTVNHTFRQAGPHTVGAIVEGTRGQQARANLSLDIFFQAKGDGNIGLGTGGAGLLEDRDVKNHRVEIPGPFTNLSLRFEQGSSAGEDGTPSNLHIELYDPNGTMVASETNATVVKWLNVTGTAEQPLDGGEWVLRVKGDQGFAIGYKYELEVHYLGLAGQGSDDGHDHEHG